MSAGPIGFTAIRAARLLKKNAPPHGIDSFLARMTRVVHDQRDSGRVAFWREVAALLERAPTRLALR